MSRLASNANYFQKRSSSSVPKGPSHHDVAASLSKRPQQSESHDARPSRLGSCAAIMAAITLLNGVFTLVLFESHFSPVLPCVSGGCGAHELRLNFSSSSRRLRPEAQRSGGAEARAAAEAALHQQQRSQAQAGGHQPDPAAAAARKKARKLDLSSEPLVEHLAAEWHVAPLSSQRGVFLLQQRADYACALLLQNVCYLFMIGRGPLHTQHTGLWYAQEASLRLPAAPPRAGAGGGLGAKAEYNDRARDLSQIDLSHDVCSLYAPGKGESSGGGGGGGGAKGGGEGEKEKGKGGGPQQQDEGEEEEERQRQQYLPDAHDLTVLAARENKTYGRLASAAQAAAYVEGSSYTSRKLFSEATSAARQRRRPARVLPAGIVTRFDSHVGHFGECVVALAEAAQHLTPGSSHGREFTMLFPSDKAVRSNWTAGLARLLLGAQLGVLAGQSQGAPLCFDNVLFVLNARHTPASADLLRARARRAVARAASSPSPPSSPPFPPSFVSTHAASSRTPPPGQGQAQAQVQAAGAAGGKETAGEGGAVAGSGGRGGATGEDGAAKGQQLQISIVEREAQRTVSNLPQVAGLVRETFPGMRVEIVRLSNASLTAQMAIAQRSALYISMHGASLSNVLFMPRGALVLELFPFRFLSEEYHKIAQRCGLHYHSWENTHLANSRYVDNCLEDKGFDKLTRGECWKNRACLFCVRDRPVTTVDLSELGVVLRNMQADVRRLLSERHPSAGLRYPLALCNVIAGA
eukprot:jgi/Mesen1/10817/ME000093S10336